MGMSGKNASGGRVRDGTLASDPAHSGAKAGAFSAGATDEAFAWADSGGAFSESAAMSALLAQNWWVIALRGFLGIVFGIIALLMPGVTIAALILWFAAYMLVDGIFAIVAAVRAARRNQRWGALILEGIVDLAAAAIAFFAPIATLFAFVYLSAAWAIISGVLMLAAVFRLRRTHGKWLLALAGVVSVVWGVLLSIAPIAGALVMTWWLGAYALVFGVTLLVLAFRLRRSRGEPRGAMPQGA
jgi:uncharacterized membrane protein HdeD (DUF308 family)